MGARMTDQMIPADAIEAAYDKYQHLGLNASDIEGILETAAPHMLTRITNAVINRAYEDGRAAGLKEATK